VFGVAAVTLEAVARVYLYVPLALIEHGATLAALEDAPALIYLATRRFATGFGFSVLLLVGSCVLIGADIWSVVNTVALIF
jgi:hypothetical protein